MNAKTNAPTLKTRPPQASAGDDLAKLEALEDWTKAPAAAAAQAADLEGPPQPQKRARKAAAGQGEDQAQAKPKSRTKDRKTAPAAIKPWLSLMDKEGAAAIKLMNFKCPIELFAQTRWLAQTTYGYTMTRIIIEALQEKNAQMLKDRESR